MTDDEMSELAECLQDAAEEDVRRGDHKWTCFCEVIDLTPYYVGSAIIDGFMGLGHVFNTASFMGHLFRKQYTGTR